jgi:thioesterase domain-containing protein
MAARCIEAMRSVQPEGPWFLGGWSSGGLVAFAMAEQLLREGQPVGLLALFDAPVPGQKLRIEKAVARFVRQLRLPISLGRFLRRPPRAQLEVVLEQARKTGLFPENLTVDHLRDRARLFTAYVEAVQGYALPSYPGRLVLFQTAKDKESPQPGWDKVAAQFETRTVPGGHYTMLRDTHVKTLARQLRTCLAGARGVVAVEGRTGGRGAEGMFDDLRKPDFLGIGCVKSGSTWVWRQLAQHPEIRMPEGKEMRYFNQVSQSAITPREYLEKFQSFPRDKKTGEVTPDYIAYPHVPVLVKAMCPDARLFAVLRNPTDRAFSQYKLRGDGQWGIPADVSFEEVFFGAYPQRPVPLRFCSVRERGMYSRQLQWWYELFPPEQIKLLFFDDIVNDPLGLLRELYSFLGVDPSFVPEGYQAPRNENVRNKGLEITPEERARVSAFYREEVARLEQLTGRDLSHWR